MNLHFALNSVKKLISRLLRIEFVLGVIIINQGLFFLKPLTLWILFNRTPQSSELQNWDFTLILLLAMFVVRIGTLRKKQREIHSQVLWRRINKQYPGINFVRRLVSGLFTLFATTIVISCGHSIFLRTIELTSFSWYSTGDYAGAERLNKVALQQITGKLPSALPAQIIAGHWESKIDYQKMLAAVREVYGKGGTEDLWATFRAAANTGLKAAEPREWTTPRFHSQMQEAEKLTDQAQEIAGKLDFDEIEISAMALKGLCLATEERIVDLNCLLPKLVNKLETFKEKYPYSRYELDQKIFEEVAYLADRVGDKQLALKIREEGRLRPPMRKYPSRGYLDATSVAIILSSIVLIKLLLETLPYLCKWEWKKKLGRSLNLEERLSLLDSLTIFALYDNKLDEANLLSQRMLAEAESYSIKHPAGSSTDIGVGMMLS